MLNITYFCSTFYLFHTTLLKLMEIELITEQCILTSNWGFHTVFILPQVVGITGHRNNDTLILDAL